MLEHAGTTYESIDALPHLAEGSASDSEAFWVSAGDVNLDGLTDILTGSIQDELAVSNAGTIRVYYGQQGSLPSPEPSLMWGGAKGSDRFGVAAGVIGDLDDDGAAEILVFASRDDTLAHDAGRLYVVPGVSGSTPTPIDYPEEPAGQEYGASVAIIPGPGGKITVAVGIPRMNREDRAKSGGVKLFPMTQEGVVEEDVVVIDEHPKSGNSKQLGHRVAAAGDFDGDGLQDLAVISLSDNQPASYPSDYVCGPSCGAEAGTTSCGTSISSTGALLVYRGQPDGTFGSLPAFTYYHDEKSDKIESVNAIGNVDGDPEGRSDLAIGSRYWDSPTTDAGGVRVIVGRAHTAGEGKIQVICEASTTLYGGSTSAYAGRSATAIGDLNQDGCDDFAFGEERDDTVNTDRGAVRIVLGSGAPTCPAAWSTLRLIPENDAKYTGWSVAGGEDVDGDGVPDLAVGIPTFTSGVKTGRVLLVSGAYIAELIAANTTEAPLNDPNNVEARVIMGDGEDAYCGAMVALVPGYESDGRAAVAMGCTSGRLAGITDTGGAGIYSYTPTEGFVDEAILTIAGETLRTNNESGVALAFYPIWGGHLAVMGASFGNNNGLDAGSAYVFFMEAP